MPESGFPFGARKIRFSREFEDGWTPREEGLDREKRVNDKSLYRTENAELSPKGRRGRNAKTAICHSLDVKKEESQ